MKRKIFLIILMPLILCMFSLTGSIYAQKKTTTTTTAIKPISTQLKTLMNKRKTLTVFRSGGVSYLGPETDRKYFILTRNGSYALSANGTCNGFLCIDAKEWLGENYQAFSFLKADRGAFYFCCRDWHRMGTQVYQNINNSVVIGGETFGTDYYKFVFEDAGNNYYYIRNVKTGNYLNCNIPGSLEVKTGPKQTNNNFQFMLVEAE